MMLESGGSDGDQGEGDQGDQAFHSVEFLESDSGAIGDTSHNQMKPRSDWVRLLILVK